MLKTYNYLNEILSNLIRKYDINTDLIFDTIKNKDIFGQFNYRTNSIVIDHDKCIIYGQDMENILYHEYRHCYQYDKYNDVFNWWLNPARREEYNTNYFLPVNCIEADAYEFGDSYGNSNKEYLLKYYNVRKLQFLYDSGLIKK